MISSSSLLRRAAVRRTGRRIGVLVAAVVAVGASPAAAQYGTGTPLAPLPPLPSTAVPPAADTSPAQAGVAGAVGGGDATPAANTTSGEGVAGTGTDATAPTVAVVSDERAAPASTSGDDLPFTGANIGIFVAIGTALLVLGLGVRRRSGLSAAKP